MKNKRDFYIGCRVTKSEKQSINSFAESMGMTVTELIKGSLSNFYYHNNKKIFSDDSFNCLSNRNNFYVECGEIELIYNS